MKTPVKTTVRALSLSLVLTGIAAGAFSQKASSGIQIVPGNVPMPVCPLNDPDGCGIDKF